MKVLVATNETQGVFDGDYSWTVDGELVYIQAISCSNPSCGCTRGFAGMASSRATTTAMVVDRPEIGIGELTGALHDSLERDGWLTDITPDEADEMIAELLKTLAEITGPSRPGSIVRREGDFAFVK